MARPLVFSHQRNPSLSADTVDLTIIREKNVTSVLQKSILLNKLKSKGKERVKVEVMENNRNHNKRRTSQTRTRMKALQLTAQSSTISRIIAKQQSITKSGELMECGSRIMMPFIICIMINRSFQIIIPSNIVSMLEESEATSWQWESITCQSWILSAIVASSRGSFTFQNSRMISCRLINLR